MSEPTDHPGKFGPYRIEGELGRGAMGVVYAAVDPRLDREVALKVLRSGIDADSPALARFRQEAKACAKVRHENIVEIFEAGEVDGRPFYAMGRVPGESLAKLAKEGRAPEPRELFRGLAGIADALHALHAAGIVHRDVKPSNIIVEPGGRMVLADFGLARTATSGELTQTGEALGTPMYMSPEQALGKREEVDGRTDVYGLGATLYEVLTGRPPFEADDTRGMMRQILFDRPTSVRAHAPDVPRDAEDVVMKALEKRPEDRYATAAEMRDDLAAFAAGRQTRGRPVPPFRRFLRRNRARGIVAAVLLLVATVLVVRFETRPALLTVLSRPPATVLIDGEVVGTTPVTRKLDAGTHEICMRQDHFKDSWQTITLEAGEKRTWERVLVAENPEDPVALAKLEDCLLGPAPPPVPVAKVSPRGKPWEGVGALKERNALNALFPRGRVRPQDLDKVCFEVPPSMAAAPRGTLLILRGDEELHRSDVTVTCPLTEVEIPAEVRAAVRDGDSVRWVLRTAGGAEIEADCRVVGERLEKKLAELAQCLEGQDPRVVAHLRTRLLLREGLDYAAFKEARRLAEEQGASPQAEAAMKKALEGLELSDADARRTLRAVLAEIRDRAAEKKE